MIKHFNVQELYKKTKDNDNETNQLPTDNIIANNIDSQIT